MARDVEYYDSGLVNTDPQGRVEQPNNRIDSSVIVEGGGSGARGGGVSIIRGCTDPNATNYNSGANVDDGSCLYPNTITDSSAGNKRITFNVVSDPSGASTFVNDRRVFTPETPTEFNFTNKELLEPKVIRVEKTNSISSEIYRISTIKQQKKKVVPRVIQVDDTNEILPITNDEFINQNIDGRDLREIDRNLNRVTGRITGRQITLNDLFIYDYFELKVEKLIDGVYVDQNISQPEESTPDFYTLQFTLRQKDVEPQDNSIKINVNADLPDTTSRFIRLVLSDGREINLTNGQTQLDFKPNSTSNYIQSIQGPDATYLSYGVTTVIRNGNRVRTVNTFDFKEEVGNEDVSIDITISKANKPPTFDQPRLSVSSNSFNYNLSSSSPLTIDYTSQFAENVRYSLSGITKELPPRGRIELRRSDFTKGLGQYKLYLQPYSQGGGSGNTVQIVISVSSTNFIPGPDIRTIQFPELIEGKDYQGFNVDFDITYSSINTNYVRIYVNKVDNSFLLRDRLSGSGKVTLNVQEVLRKSREDFSFNTDQIPFKLLFVPFNTQGDQLASGKVEEVDINFKQGLRIKRQDLIRDIRESFSKEYNTSIFEDAISPYLTHYLHIGESDNKLISTWGIDTQTFENEPSLVLKLYEPLPFEVDVNSEIWISKISSIPIIDEITLIDEEVKECRRLTPNFSVDTSDVIGYQVLDQLIASGSSTSAELINEYVSSSEFNLSDLHFNFVTGSDYYWKDFVKFSSATERIENFYYKVKLIESYNTDIQNLSSGSGLTDFTGSLSVVRDINQTQQKRNKLIGGFDSFEKFLYESSSESGLTYPKLNDTGSLLNTTSSEVQTWYLSAIDSAQEYDFYNKDNIVNNLPTYIKNDNNNSEFILFFNMIGNHFDVIWSYAKGFQNSKKLEHKLNKGINDELVYHMLESLGWDADLGVQSQFLWEYAFGHWNKDKEERTGGTTKSSLTGKERQQEIWRRLLNNLPYLLKHKGTKRALHAAMACYGIPSSLLTVLEFGGPTDRTTSRTKDFTFDDRTAAINFNQTAEILVPWLNYESKKPESVELRINTQQRQDQLLISASGWNLTLLKDTGSLAKFELSVLSGSTFISQSTNTLPFFNEEFTQVVVNKTTSGGNDVFDVYVKEAFQERIRNEASASLTITGTTAWNSGSEISIGSGFTGSLDEFRLWRVPLQEDSINNHTKMPDAIDGNSYSSSTEDLLFRMDFEYPKNRHSSGDTGILNVAINRTYGADSGSAVNFPLISEYPYNYTTYERTVTAKVPSTGTSFSNKFRFEDQTKIRELSYKTRSTKKSFDQAPIDSDRLGLFFSPIKEINMDIVKSLGSFNIDDYIGNPSDLYNDEYSDLKVLREYYFDRYNLNIYEYIQLVRYIDKTIFTTLESLVPARAKVAKGLLIEPHILERSKTKWNKPQGDNRQYEGNVDIEEDINLTSQNILEEVTIDTQEDVVFNVENPQYDGLIQTEEETILTAERLDYSSSINTEETTLVFGEITRNSGSLMGGFEITINAQITGTVQGEYENTSLTDIGLDPQSVGVAGFGLYAENGYGIRTRLDSNGTYVKDRVKVFKIKEQYKVATPQLIVSGSPDSGEQLVDTNYFRHKVSILPFTGSDGNESPDLSVGGNIVGVEKLDGYFDSHYKYVGDLTTGLLNSYHKGSKQTSATTTDGGSPVVTFITNPNTLRVTETGRGSGEPILVVE